MFFNNVSIFLLEINQKPLRTLKWKELIIDNGWINCCFSKSQGFSIIETVQFCKNCKVSSLRCVSLYSLSFALKNLRKEIFSWEDLWLYTPNCFQSNKGTDWPTYSWIRWLGFRLFDNFSETSIEEKNREFHFLSGHFVLNDPRKELLA